MSFYNKFKTGILLFCTLFLPIMYNLFLLKLYTLFICIMCYLEFYKHFFRYNFNFVYHLFLFYWLLFPIFIVSISLPLLQCWNVITITIFSDMIQQISNKFFIYSNISNSYINSIMLYNPFPSLSPNKTVIGYLGGTLTILLSYIYDYHIILFFSFYVFGCVGDLFASYFKRIRKIENYSNLLGSHGGFLDRFDSILFNLHLLYIYSFFIQF